MYICFTSLSLPIFMSPCFREPFSSQAQASYSKKYLSMILYTVKWRSQKE
nr:MAG TPA: hypothetical protein [Caudoviricetes sp.]